MFNEMIVVSVTPFSGSTSTDKNNKSTVMLQCIAGKMPNRNVLSGTVAERAGFEVGKTYLAQVREVGFDKDYGPDFNYIMVKELVTGKDIAETSKRLGAPEILNVPRPAGFEQKYTRKSTAVEGQRVTRIKEGSYEPSSGNRSTYEHATAKEIVEGTSLNSGGELEPLETDALDDSDLDLDRHKKKKSEVKTNL